MVNISWVGVVNVHVNKLSNFPQYFTLSIAVPLRSTHRCISWVPGIYRLIVFVNCIYIQWIQNTKQQLLYHLYQLLYHLYHRTPNGEMFTLFQPSYMCYFLGRWWTSWKKNFLEEQVESIKKFSDYVTNLDRVGSGLGEYQFDKLIMNE